MSSIPNIITFSSKPFKPIAPQPSQPPLAPLPPIPQAVAFTINSFDPHPNPDPNPNPDPIPSSSPLPPNPFSSPIRNGEQGWIRTPTRTRVRAYTFSGFSQNQIAKQLRKKHSTLISQSTISRIITSKRNRRTKSTGPKRRLSNRIVRV
jgi:hypothetical protein